MFFVWMSACGYDPEKAPESDTDTDTYADSDADTDSDTDTDTDPTGSTGHTATDSGTPPVVETWTGTYHVEVVDSGFVANSDQCDTTLTLQIDPSASPAVTGTVACTMAGTLAGQTFTLTFTGDVPAADPFGGDVTGTYPAVPYPMPATWEATHVDADTIAGRSIGHWSMGGDQAFDWTATFQLDLQP